MKPTRFVLALVLTFAAAGAARAADPARLAAAQRKLADAAYGPGPQRLAAARADLESMSKAEPKSAALHYWVALADWRLAPRLDDPKQVQRFCKDGLDHAKRALELDPKLAEALAIKAGLQGIALRLDPGSAMTVGMEIEANMKRALELGPSNPRVHLMDAINTLHKPDFVGGGADKALVKLERAEKLFAAESVSDSLAPAWGHEEALIWSGKSAMKLGDHAAARGFYDRALAIDPDNAWVLRTLIPELEKATLEAAAKKATR